MKKVLIFSLVYYPRFIGGAEIAVKETTDRLGEDFQFDMITLRKDALKFERIGNVNVYRVGFGWRRSENSFLSRSKIYKYFAIKSLQAAKYLTVDSVKMKDRILELSGCEATVVQNGINEIGRAHV